MNNTEKLLMQLNKSLITTNELLIEVVKILKDKQ